MSTTWPVRCACSPGSHADGWRERRCDECLRIERQIWSDFMNGQSLRIDRIFLKQNR